MYVEVAVGGPENRNRIIPVRNLKLLYGKRQTYRSYFTYPHDRLIHTESGGTTRDYRGLFECGLGHVWDIDTPTNIKAGMESAYRLIEKLIGLGVPTNQVKAYYSGQKGIHVAIPDLFGFKEGEYVHVSVLKTLMEFWPEADRMIYTRTGMIRLPYTQHGATHRYKVQLLPEDLLGPVDSVIDLSLKPEEAQHRIPHEPIFAEEIIPCLEEYKIEADPRPITSSAYVIDGGEGIPDYLTCMFHLERDGIASGNRHAAVLRLAAAYHHRGVPQSSTVSILRAWAESVSSSGDIYPISEVDKAIEWAYSRPAPAKFKCEDEIMQMTCDPHCKLYARLEESQEFTMTELAHQYVHEATENRTQFSLADAGLKGVGFTVRERELILIVGDTKLGKSSLIWNWLVNLPHLNCLYLSPEMGPTTVFEKLVQIKYNKQIRLDKGVNELIPMMKDGSILKAAEGLKHIQIRGTSPSIEMLRRVVREHKYDVIVIDPYESLHSENNTEIHPDKIADALREICTESKAIILCIVHINKAGQKEDRDGEHIELWMIKGHKRIQEQADHIIAFEGKSGSITRDVRLLRGRNAQDLDICLEGNPYTQRFFLSRKEIINANTTR
jgi:hypothetical protein